MGSGSGPFWEYLFLVVYKEHEPVFVSSTTAPAEQLDFSCPEQLLLLPPALWAFPKGKRPALSLHKLRRLGGERQWWLQSLPPLIEDDLSSPAVAWQPAPWIWQGGRSRHGCLLLYNALPIYWLQQCWLCCAWITVRLDKLGTQTKLGTQP